MRAGAIGALLVAAFAGGGCGDAAAIRNPPPTPPPEPPPPVTEEPTQAPCHVDAPTVLHHQSSTLRTAVAVSIQGDRGLVAIGDASDFRVIPVDGVGRGRDGIRSVDGATGALFAFAPVGEQRHVAVFKTRCDGAVCLRAMFLSADGDLEATQDSPPLAPLWTKKHASADDALLIAVGHETAAPDLLLFTSEGVSHTSLPSPPSVRSEVLGLAAAGDRWTVLYRSGAAETDGSRVVALSAGDREPTEVPELHDALAIEAFAHGDEGVAAIAAFEFSRPQFMVLGQEPELLAPEAPLPPPFTSRYRARAYRAQGLTFSDVSTLAGDSVARRLQVTRVASSDEFEPDIARIGPKAFVVATLRDEGHDVVTVRVRCDP